MCFKLLTGQYDSDDNLVVHSSDIHFKVSEARVTEVRKTWRLTPRGMESGWRGAQADSRRRRLLAGWHARYSRQQRGTEGLRDNHVANGGPEMHTSQLRKGFPDRDCVLKRYWTAVVCSCFPGAKVSNRSVYCLVERGNNSPRC